ncbi:MAG TPA: glycosyl hydrolase family 28-related protein [Planctomycetota bacterium]|nr:glycosyl hydrolase family 28-related protein [Planctomycetota bacterium]HRR79925.1 glycosyl hydrolase family 28-related protein [Planctomycetota bacterium]HRT94570.1 glycosyl hydrolase family 28-related protein [Planctomycetota bacterium]
MKPRVIETSFPTDDVVIASLVIDAPKDGVGDATGGIQAAIDEAAAAGGAVVFLPAGRYRLAGRLTVKEGVTLRGDFDPFVVRPSGRTGGDGLKPALRTATILMPAADKGNADGPPAITMERGTGLTNLAIWYPDQDPMKIVPYPWTIRTSEKATGNNITIQNVTLVNPYQAIKIGPEWNELHTIRNVVGTPLKAGIWMDTTTDIGRVTDVDFGPRWWTESGLPGSPVSRGAMDSLESCLRREGIAFEMRRSDWEYLQHIRATCYKTGFLARAGRQGTANAVMAWSEFGLCETALRLEALNEIGLSASGCIFLGDRSVDAPESFNSTAQFQSCTFNSPPLLDGPGTLTFERCFLDGPTTLLAEAAKGQISMLGCLFTTKDFVVRLGERVRRVRLLGNTARSLPRIEGRTPSDALISGYDFRPGALQPFPGSASPNPVLPNRRLFLVTDFGAGQGEQDNTAAFTKALEAARKAGGGTVYVPAGNYRFAGEIVVPSGVELRGIFDVPHHTVSGGSVLMTTSGKGKADGTPFIRLEAKSGLRGLTIWYPEQDLRNIQPYPWAIQSLGPGCWLVDVTLGNAYQGADFWTHPSDGHVIRYLAGAVFKRGLFVSKCKGDGWVEDVQFNPHYSVRVHPSLASPFTEGKNIQAVIEYQRANLEGIVFGACENEHVRGTFLYAAYDGIAFRDDAAWGHAAHKGANATVINHGTDTGSRCAVLEGSANVTFINAQLVPLGAHEVGAIIVGDSFKGKASFFNTQIWGGKTSGIIGGSGDVLIQGVNTLCGPFTLKGGRVAIENAHWTRDMPCHIRVESSVESARLIANLAPNELKVESGAGGKLYARCNSLALPPPAVAGRLTFKTGFEAGEPQPAADAIAKQGGGLKSVSKPECRVAEGGAVGGVSPRRDTRDEDIPPTSHGGKRALRVSGVADDPAYSHVYCTLFEETIGIAPDSVLSYWIRPTNERGRCVGLDLLVADGSTLRDSGARTTDGQGVHPGNPKGEVGKWTKIAIPLGQTHAGKAIAAVLVAYDSRSGGGPFEAWIDDLAIESAQAPSVPVAAKPAGGVFQGKVAIELVASAGSIVGGASVPRDSRDGDVPPTKTGRDVVIRYSLDGLSPTAESPRYERPIHLDQPGLWELRFAAFGPEGRQASRVIAELYEVR